MANKYISTTLSGTTVGSLGARGIATVDAHGVLTMCDRGIDMEADLLKQAVDTYELVTKAGAFYSYKDQRLGQGADNAAKFLRENTTIRDTLVAEILAANAAKIAGIPIPADQDGEEPEAEAIETPAPAPKKRGRGADKGE